MSPLNWIVGLVIAGLLALAGVQTVRLSREQAAHANDKATYATTVSDWNRETRVAVDAARTEEQRRTAAVLEIANDTQTQLDRARTDADRAHSAADSLRGQLAAFVTANRGAAARDPGVVDAGPPGSTALDVLADLFSRADDSAGILAAALDRSHTAGVACERQYDALTK